LNKTHRSGLRWAAVGVGIPVGFIVEIPRGFSKGFTVHGMWDIGWNPIVTAAPRIFVSIFENKQTYNSIKTVSESVPDKEMWGACS